MALDKNLFRNWIDGDVFSARDYVYERNLIIDYINENTITQDEVLEGLFDARYYTETELNAGQLDNRYYTETELNAGQLDNRYYTETEVNGLFTTERNRLSRLESKFDATVLAENDQLFDQAVNTDSAVEFTSVKLGANTVNEAFIDGLEDKYTVAGADAQFVAQSTLGVANGVATLDGDGRLPAEQLPLNTVVFRGTFGSAGSTTGGDLPSNGTLETGDFYICDTDAYVSVAAGLTFDNGDKAVYTGTAWSKIDNTETVTGVKGSEEVDYRVGNVSLSHTNVGAAAAVHTHVEADITDLDKYTQSEVNTLLAGKSDTGHTHVEADITDLDKYTTTQVDGFLATKSDVGHTHVEADITDLDKYTQTEVDNALALKLNTSLKGAPNGLAELDGDGKVPAGQLPSYVDDVLEYADLASFPATGTSGKIYVAQDTGKTYRWGVTQYVEIAANEVNSVNGKTGNITLAGSDLAIEAEDVDINAAAFSGVLTTDDTRLDTALATIDAHTHDYTDITNKPSLYTQGEVDALLDGKVNFDDLSAIQNAQSISYDPSASSNLTATNLQGVVDELDSLIQANTSVLKIQRFVITDNNGGADGNFTYTYNGNNRTGTIASGQYRFDLEDSVVYIVGANRLEIKVNNNLSFYSPDTEIEEIDTNTVGITYALQNNDEVFIKVYQGLDTVALNVEDGSITTAKLSTGLQADLTSYDNHIASTANPHGVTKTQVGLGNVTNDAQVKADPSGSIDGNVATWSGTNGDALGTGYGVQTTLSSSTGHLVRADAIATAVNAKQDTLVSTVNIKTINGTSILGSGNYEIDIPSVDIASTAPANPNVGDLWWNDTDGVLYIYYNDGTSSQWVSVSYADVEAAINNLIASAPAALDTLNELAAALGDDPNFATTISTSIGLKADQTDLDTLETTVGTKADKNASFVALSANHTLELTNKDKVLNFTNSAAVTITVPDNATIAFPVGSQIAVLRNGAGTVTFAGASGVTVNSKDSLLSIAGQYGSAALLKTGTDVWQLVGSLE